MNEKNEKNEKHGAIKNYYDIYEIKKMIGKKLLILHPMTKTQMIDKKKIESIEHKILSSKNKKNITLVVICAKGVLYVIKNIEFYLAIKSTSYKEIKKNDIDKKINILIMKYSNVSKNKIRELMMSNAH